MNNSDYWITEKSSKTWTTTWFPVWPGKNLGGLQKINEFWTWWTFSYCITTVIRVTSVILNKYKIKIKNWNGVPNVTYICSAEINETSNCKAWTRDVLFYVFTWWMTQWTNQYFCTDKCHLIFWWTIENIMGPDMKIWGLLCSVLCY